MDTNLITKTDKFAAPIARKKNGEYKIKIGLVYVCFSSDFLLEDAAPWRTECWDMIRERKDCQFLFLTKRNKRFLNCIPEDWGDGWDNVIVGCTVENQKLADERLCIFSQLPIKHKNIIYQPIISAIDLEQYLAGVELVVAAANRTGLQDPCTITGCFPCGSSASVRMCPLSSVSAEPTSSRMAENTPYRRRICVPRRERLISTFTQNKAPLAGHE